VEDSGAEIVHQRVGQYNHSPTERIHIERWWESARIFVRAKSKYTPPATESTRPPNPRHHSAPGLADALQGVTVYRGMHNTVHISMGLSCTRHPFAIFVILEYLQERQHSTLDTQSSMNTAGAFRTCISSQPRGLPCGWAVLAKAPR